MPHVLRFLLLPALIALLCASAVLADPGDTTIVNTFTAEFHNWASPHTRTFYFPDSTHRWSRIMLRYDLGCPGAPGDCDPWDRIGMLSVLRPTSDTTSEAIEIARIVTPYDITGSGRPGSCGWDFDVTDYASLLHDSVQLQSYIETWINDTRGWLVTTTFYLIEGTPEREAYRVERLWNVGYLVYGDPDRPPEAHNLFGSVELDGYTDSVKVRCITTGHGQGNTHNAAEFSQTTHSLFAGDDLYAHELWRADCSSNPCSPQGGTWQYARAGWCPGSRVYPWDVIPNIVPGEVMVYQYGFEAYENFCRPTNPLCISGQTCTDCNYNYNGHTEPNYNTQGQAILYRVPVSPSAPRVESAPADFALEQNYPNPFNPSTLIAFSLDYAARVELRVFDVNGRLVSTLLDTRLSAGKHVVRFSGAQIASGVYFYALNSAGRQLTRKMLLLK